MQGLKSILQLLLVSFVEVGLTREFVLTVKRALWHILLKNLLFIKIKRKLNLGIQIRATDVRINIANLQKGHVANIVVNPAKAKRVNAMEADPLIVLSDPLANPVVKAVVIAFLRHQIGRSRENLVQSELQVRDQVTDLQVIREKAKGEKEKLLMDVNSLLIKIMFVKDG